MIQAVHFCWVFSIILFTGCIGGSAWHFVKGLKNAPKHSRMRSAFHAIMTRAPVLGGIF